MNKELEKELAAMKQKRWRDIMLAGAGGVVPGCLVKAFCLQGVKMHTIQELRQKQSMPLQAKIAMTENRIRQWYNYHGGNVYVSFSGGKDSTVLLDIARKIFPEIKAMFIDTGLEYPEIREFVKSIENVDIVKPVKSFYQVIKKYGYPVVSKEVSHKIEYAKKGSLWAKKYITGEQESQYNIVKWKFLIDSPFNISNKCCDIMKKNPAHKYSKETGLVPITGQMASESMLRTQKWIQNGCNAFKAVNPVSNPMSFWLENDVLQYIYENKIKICSLYGNVEPIDGALLFDDENIHTRYRCTGLSRTGCMFCMFGVHLEGRPNRFDKMKKTHPDIYQYCMDKLKLKEVLSYIGIEQ